MRLRGAQLVELLDISPERGPLRPAPAIRSLEVGHNILPGARQQLRQARLSSFHAAQVIARGRIMAEAGSMASPTLRHQERSDDGIQDQSKADDQ